jgi:7-carboxy-7-deazaguanine synthase
MRDDVLIIHEIYASIQGESSFAGLPCTFVRTTGCNLRCSWCDTTQAFHGGEKLSRSEVLRRALAFDTPLVELTGG